jgi:Amt family ammonium transporter
MKLIRLLTGLAPALAAAVFIGLAAPAAMAQNNPPAAAPATDAAPAAAAPAAPAAPPSCSATVLEKCTSNSGDTAWLLTSVALVLMMTIPGLGLFYGGMVGKKNVGDTVMTSFAITALVTVIYFILTYSLAFTGGSAFIGGFSRVFLQGIHYDLASGANTPNPLAPTIPETVYMMFQMTFAIITPALIAGSFAERMKFSAMLWFIGLWAIFVYAPVAHWVWGPDGFMSAVNVDAKGNFQGWFQVLDFAGGTVVISTRASPVSCRASCSASGKSRARPTTWC